MSKINADTSNGLKFTSDTSGEIKLQSAGTDIATVDSSGITMASGKTISGGEIIQNAGAVFRASSTVNQDDIEAGVQTKILFPTVEFDIGDNFASSRFTAPIDGYYHFSATTHIVAATGLPQMNLYVNGGIKAYGTILYLSSAHNVSPTISTTVYLKTGDYAEAYAYSSNATSFYGAPPLTWFSGFLVRAA